MSAAGREISNRKTTMEQITHRQMGRITRENRLIGGNDGAGPQPEQERKRHPRSYDSAWSDTEAEPKEWVPEPAYESLEEAPTDLVLRASQEKMPWVKEHVENGQEHGTLMKCARKCVARSPDLSEEDIPPYSTLNTWSHQFAAYGLLGLVDKVRSDAGTSRTLTEEEAETVQTMVAAGETSPAAITNELADNCDPEKPPAKYGAVRRYARKVAKENPHLVALGNLTERAFRSLYQMALDHGVLPGGSALQVDTTVADQWVRVRDASRSSGWRPVRPILTVVQDVGSRLLVTFNCSLKKIDSEIVRGTFLRAVNEEHNYPGLISTGLPQEVWLDRGPEHKGEFENTLKQLGVKVRMNEDPEGRARLENLFDTINSEVLQNRPGYSPTEQPLDPYVAEDGASGDSRNLRSLKYEPRRSNVPVEALDTLADFEHQLLAFATAYNDRPHPGLRANDQAVKKLLSARQAADDINSIEEAA